MGNEISTVGGAIAIAGTGILVGVTFGQVDVLNKAVVDTANFSAKHAEKTVVRHVGETVVNASGVVVAAACAAATGGKNKRFIDEMEEWAKKTAEAGERAGAEIVSVADGMSDGIPVVGHIKGGICYAIGDHERGERWRLRVGMRARPIARGIAAGAAMDGIITGAEFVIHDEFKPHGNVAYWDQALNGKAPDKHIGGIIGGVVTPVFDGMVGLAAGKAVAKAQQRADIAKLDKVNKGKLEMPVEKSASSGSASSEIPEEALADQNDVVYRGDRRFLDPEAREQVFREGVFPDCDVSLNDALPHVQAEYRANFVSTSPDVAIARDFGFARNGRDWAFAEVAGRNGVRINIAAEFLNKVARFAGQNEYSIFKGIKPQDIKGIYEFARGKFAYHPNPNFVPPVPGIGAGHLAGAGACVLFMTSKALHGVQSVSE